jgi:glycosyltransferase involved in cell wall biosynthesis
MNPKVTILMAVFNGEEYIKDCIDSVLSQTYKDFEFLIIDDCSADSSIGIVKSYDDARIRVIENKRNLNQVKSLNIGLTHARGEYVARIDQDDMMLRHRLEKQVEFLDKRRDVSVVGTWGEVIDEKGSIFTILRLPVTIGEIAANVLFAGHFLMHSSVIFRKDPVIESGKYDETFSFAEDYDLWTRLLLKGYRFANIPECLIKFRYHKKTSSRKFSDFQLNNTRRSISNFIKSIIDGDCSPALERLLDILINMGLMNKDFFASEADSFVHSAEIIDLLDRILTKTARHLNFNKNETYLMKKIFYNKLLNFIFQGRRLKSDLSINLYSYCLKNFVYILGNPRFYIYPLASGSAYGNRKK